MFASKIVVSRTKQIRQYEPERIEIEVSLTEGESILLAIARARKSLAIAFKEAPDEATIARLEEELRTAKAEGV